jgi:hypothetical protein
MTFIKELKKYEFTDYEADDNVPIVSDMYHKDDIIKALNLWLEKHRKNYGRTKTVYYLVRQQTIDWLLADLESPVIDKKSSHV